MTVHYSQPVILQCQDVTVHQTTQLPSREVGCVCAWWLIPPRLHSGSVLIDYMATLLSWLQNAWQLIACRPFASDPRIIRVMFH